jgi:predicted naringenin-chalcone synthase
MSNSFAFCGLNAVSRAEGLLINAFINWISSAVPDHDIHAPFIAFAHTLLVDEKTRTVLDRMAERSGITHRYSAFRPGNIAKGEVDEEGFYRRGRFPGTGARMARYERDALALALRAVEAVDLTIEGDHITHLIVASCTGFAAPGLDLQLASTLKLRSDVKRTLVGFMGCSAAVPALRLAHDIVRLEPAARVWL